MCGYNESVWARAKINMQNNRHATVADGQMIQSTGHDSRTMMSSVEFFLCCALCCSEVGTSTRNSTMRGNQDGDKVISCMKLRSGLSCLIARESQQHATGFHEVGGSCYGRFFSQRK